MTARTISLATLAAILASTACQPPARETASSVEDDVAYLKTIADQFDEALTARDPDGLAALYADNAVRMMPDLPAWVGNEAIRAGFARDIEVSAERWSAIEVDNVAQEVVVFGDWATVRGTFTAQLTPADGGERITNTGKWLAFHKRQSDGTWKVVWDIWNRDTPLPERGAESEM